MNTDRKQLRAALRAKRLGLSPAVQRTAAEAVAHWAFTQTVFPLGQHVALYMDADGEVGTRQLLDGLLERGKSCYLPVLLPETVTLEFRQYLPDRPLVTNFFGLLEPDDSAPVIAPGNLDTVFMPLVGFDENGNRLGMGKGYYDRTFAFLLTGKLPKPVLIGLAHECQRVGELEAAGWDVPLEGIITAGKFHAGR